MHGRISTVYIATCYQKFNRYRLHNEQHCTEVYDVIDISPADYSSLQALYNNERLRGQWGTWENG